LIISVSLCLETDRKKHIGSANKPAALRTPTQHKFVQKEAPVAAAEGAGKKDDKEELEKAWGKNDGPCVSPMPRTFETAALLKSGVGGSATHGTGDPSHDQIGASDGQGLPGAQGSGTVNSDGSSYKGEPAEGDAGDEANTFGPGKAVKK